FYPWNYGTKILREQLKRLLVNLIKLNGQTNADRKCALRWNSQLLVEILVAQPCVAGIVNWLAITRAFVFPAAHGGVLPALNLLRRWIAQRFGQFGITEFGIINHVAVPYAVQVAVGTEPHDLNVVAAPVIATAYMQGLVNISHQVNQPFQPFYFLFGGKFS